MSSSSPEELARLNKENARVFDIDGKQMTGYEATQAMRRLETKVRKQKSIRDTARASEDIHQVRKSTARIKACKAKYEQISDITGIAQEPKRMGTPRMPKIEGKPLTNVGNGGIIRENSKKPITPITDRAIESISKVSIDGFSDEMNEFVKNQHQELLRYAKNNNGSNEVAFVFRKGLEDKTVYIGSEDNTFFGSDLYTKGQDVFVMHNHPRNSSFSKSDVQTFIGSDNIKYVSIVKNNGNVEVLTKTSAFRGREAYIDFMRIKKIYAPNETSEEYEVAMGKILKKLEKKGYISHDFDINQISAEKFGISKERWGRYLEMMLDAGYIKGINVYTDCTDDLCVDNEGIRITIKGLEYLSENTIMQRMYKTAMGIKDMIK